MATTETKGTGVTRDRETPLREDNQELLLPIGEGREVGLPPSNGERENDGHSDKEESRRSRDESGWMKSQKMNLMMNPTINILDTL
jgi:hypothetical protein